MTPIPFDQASQALDDSRNYALVGGTPWFQDAEYETFSDGEFERRHALLRQKMIELGVKCVIAPGTGNNWGFGGVLEASENPGVEWPPEAQMQVLFEELPDAQIELISGLFHELAYIKSQEEIEAIGRAGALAVAAMQAMVAQARPGMSEHQLTAVAMRVILAAEGRPAFIRIGSSPGADPALTTANPLPSRRKLKPQDLLLIEVSAMLQGVTAQVGTAVCLGQPELPVKQLWYEVTAPGYEQLETLLRPNPIRADGRWGMALSRTYLVGEDGPTCLTEYPMNLDVVDPDLNGWVE